jgi:hypothetical protein
MIVRVYKLDIVYPEGSREPGWHPALWRDPAYLRTLTREQRREIRALLRKPFKWPRERRFLSPAGAYGRAWLLRFYGAEVEVYASDPVTWPNVDDEAADERWDQGSTAARWYPALDSAAKIQETRDWNRTNATMYGSPELDAAQTAACEASHVAWLAMVDRGLPPL